MADNVTTQTSAAATLPDATKIATDVATYSGDASAHVQLVRCVGISGSEGSKTVTAEPSDALFGAVTETAPVSDTASSGLNGRLQRIAQRLTSLIALLPTALGANGGLKIEGVASGTAVPISVASVPSHAVTNAGTFATQVDGAALTSLQLIDDVIGAQGSTTSGQKGALVQGAVTTAAPTYTTGQTSPVSLTPAGSVRVCVEEDEAGDSFLESAVQAVEDLTSGADLSVLAAAGSGVRNYVTDVEVINTSGDATRVDLYDGDPDSAGVLIASVPVGAAGVIKAFNTPRKGSTNTAIFAQATGGDCSISIGGFTSVAG